MKMSSATNSFQELIGKRCKLVVKEPGDTHPKAIHGQVKDINDTLLLFESDRGIGSYNLQFIIAIKPQQGEQ